ncbi:MAG: YceH family protein, partial [Verrucomicrobiales bacterium]
METQLNDTEVRVLGVLIEKEMTTPLSYPLTLNSVTTACNQKSNRYPVVDYVDTTVMKAIDSLRDKHLASTVFPGSSRTAKYKHDFAYQFGLNGKLQALLGVLMLRGPQTAGELRTRTERMVSFESLPAVIENLEELITREEGALVTLLPPGPSHNSVRNSQPCAKNSARKVACLSLREFNDKVMWTCWWAGCLSLFAATVVLGAPGDIDETFPKVQVHRASSLIQDTDGTLWVGGFLELCHLSAEGVELHRFSHSGDWSRLTPHPQG